ncbi:hypothetical protein CAEBREN_28752 [Caenorhabditis brenneri]|uniref:Uncharacterized protein n=1 Tax=Caenorhabditis brenneri TaxID=135651 RepID=G0NZ00_CAEBE|nr:hypothetical protein CAEBREN_28752 [Caenorhabditis brenneri]
MFSKCLLQKTIGVPILIGGWSVSLYMLHFAWTNFQSIMLEYQKYVIGYFAAVLLISMAVCYRRGPPTDARSHDIAQWTLQLIALVLIYFSVQMVEVSFGTIFALILQQIGRGFLFSGIGRYFSGLRTFWRKCFPKKRRLLNEEEYDDIGRQTTREQLELLKEYCKKEGNHPWKIAGNVRSARRLARFIEGEDDHVTDDEIYAHEMTGDILDREDYEENFGEHYSHIHRSFRDGAHESIEEDEQDENEDEQEWDDIVVKRRDTFSGGGTVQSIRVPRSVSSRLLSPYENRMNRSLGPSVGYRRPDPIPIDNGFYSDQRRQAPRTEYIRRSRRVEYDATRNRVKPPKTSQLSQAPRLRNTQSSSAAMTPSEYMRRVRNVDGPSRTPTRRNRETNSHDHSDPEEVDE